MTAENVGARIREIRMRQGISLRSLAQAVGVSASLVSQVETGKTQPSVSTLYALVTQLGVSFDELLGAAPSPGETVRGGAPTAAPGTLTGPLTTHGPPVQRAEDNPVIEMENGVQWQRLAAGEGGPADALLVTYQPGAASSVEGKLMRHAGVEYAYVIEGEITLQIEFETHVLGPGDSLQFDSVRPHLYSNNGDVVARGVWFVVGRRAQNDAVPTAPGAQVRAAEAPVSSAVDVLQAMDELGR